MRIYHNGMMIFDSGKVTGKHNFEIPYSGEEKEIRLWLMRIILVKLERHREQN